MKKIGLLFCLVSIVSCGCASAPVRLYDETTLNDKSILVSLKSESDWGKNVILHSVDGIEGSNEFLAKLTNRRTFNNATDGSFNIELLPGKHTLVCTPMNWVGHNIQFTRIPQTLEFNAEPGKKYVMRVKEDYWDHFIAYIEEKQ
jgi:hypothetical protein